MYNISKLEIPDLLLIEPEIHKDQRGLFFEFYKLSAIKNYDFPKFIQDNISVSKKDVIRGLHFQSEPHSQGKLVVVLKGKIFDVAVDIRQGSDTFGQYFSIYLDDIDHKILYIPPGFAHGFCALSEKSIVLYKNTKEYNSSSDNGIIWNDSDLDIEWPCDSPIISDKDKSYLSLKELF